MKDKRHIRTYRNKALRKLGLPECLFDKDMPELYETALKQWEEMSKRMVELENSPEWKGKEFPWSAERAAYVASDQDKPGIELVQAFRPSWTNKLYDLAIDYQLNHPDYWKRDWQLEKARIAKKKALLSS